MKTIRNKMVKGLLLDALITSIGATVAAGALDDATSSMTVLASNDVIQGMDDMGPFASNLTDEQQTEIWNLITNLTEEEATSEEMKVAIRHKLDEFGVLDTWLSFEIAKTEQLLATLNMQKELRDEGYVWTDINNITQDEGALTNMNGPDLGFTNDVAFHSGPRGGSGGFLPPEESDQ